MTEKRFRSSPTDDNNFADVLDNEEWIGSCHVDCADDFCKKMNELNDENERLKQSIKRQQSSNEKCSKYIEEVAKENEQLKLTNECLLRCLDNIHKETLRILK